MAKGRQRKGFPENFVPKALSADQVKEIVEGVKRDLREAAAERRRLGIPDPEAPGLTPDSRNSSYGDPVRDLSFPVERERSF